MLASAQREKLEKRVEISLATFLAMHCGNVRAFYLLFLFSFCCFLIKFWALGEFAALMLVEAKTSPLICVYCSFFVFNLFLVLDHGVDVIWQP